MNVLVTLNRGYLGHFGVMLSTLIPCTADSVHLYVLHDDLTKEDEAEERRLFPEVEFTFISMDKTLCEGFPAAKRYPYTVYYRIFAPLVLPKEVDRILYLDCDLVIHNNIDGFYRMEFGDALFAACSHTERQAFVRMFNRVRLGVGRDKVYMNTGVLLMNVKALRAALDVDEIREYTVDNKRRLILFDQDVMCRFFGDRVIVCDTMKYNLSDRQLIRLGVNLDDDACTDWVDKNNVIVHYIGKNKPWKPDYRGRLDGYYKKGEALFSERKERKDDKA